MRWLIFALAVIVAATGATLANYGSLSPCRWLAVDTAAQSGLPVKLAAVRTRADFALSGVIEPSSGDCLRAWWRVRAADGGKKSLRV